LKGLLDEPGTSLLGGEQGAPLPPGSNLKGAVGGANWCFLLPSLELGRIVCFGRPSPAALATLARLGDEVVVCAPARTLRRIKKTVGATSPDVALLETDSFDAAALPDACVDLVLVARTPVWAPARRRLERETARLLKRDGLVYVETSSLDQLTGGGRTGSTLARLGTSLPLWLGPAKGEVRAAAPLEDRHAIGFLERRLLKSRLLRRQLLRRPARVLSLHPRVNRVVGRRGTLIRRSGEEITAEPPRYLRDVAAAAGVSIEDSRWALAAPGDYPSQKLLVFLFGSEGGAPQAIVKITRDASLNPRLENEWRALTILHERGIGSDDVRPRPLFFGVHGGLAVLGESAIAGSPFRERTHATEDCPYARAAIEWLLDLGTATVSRAREDARGALSELEARFQRFREIYRLEADEEDFLAAQVAALTRSDNGFPLVFQHGDPGPWNLLITTAGKPAFVDWEAAEPHGMPLWDLFHFLRSYGLRVSRATGTREPLRSFAEQYLEESALARLLVLTTRRFCARTGLAEGLVEPLFYTCWVHRGLKEAATLPPERLASGRYLNILRLAIARRDSPGLRRLFRAEA
jgi:SAM-dependent methyltransferase